MRCVIGKKSSVKIKRHGCAHFKIRRLRGVGMIWLVWIVFGIPILLFSGLLFLVIVGSIRSALHDNDFP
jgi:hypothetical protein